jgi:phosphoglycolate phosphatase
MFRHFLAHPFGASATIRADASRRPPTELSVTAQSPAEAQRIAHAVSGLIDAYRRLYHERVTPNTRALPEVPDTLARLRANGLRLAVATSKLTRIADEALAAAGLQPLFDRVFGMDAVERPKPEPDLALKCLAELRVPAGRALVVGDAVHDVEMGRAAGCATCAVTYGAQSREELARSEPNFLIDRFSEVIPLVGER